MTNEGEAIAVLGLGEMGSRIARRLLDRGRRVVVWNRTPEKAVALEPYGAEVAATPAEAVADVDVAITMLTDPDALVAVSEGPDGLGSMRPGQALIEMSTVGPAAVARLRDALPDGVALVDAPVLGSTDEAESGALTIFVGGTPDAVARIRPLLSELGTAIPVGGPGSGAAAKLVVNSTLFGVLAVLGEAVALADQLGLERPATFEVLAQSPLAAQAEKRRDALTTGTFRRRFGLSLARKDAGLVCDAAEATGARLPAAAAAYEWLVEADRTGSGDLDYSAVLETIVGSASRRG